jgi:hypothetical protein
MDAERDPGQLRDAIGASPGLRAYEDMEAIKRSLEVFLLNAVDLISHLKSFEEDPSVSLPVMSVGPEHEQDATQYQSELARRLHNFVSSVKSLIDHSRHIVTRMYRDPTHPVRAEYQRRARSLADEPKRKFVQQLREYVLHYELAPAVGRLEFNRTDGTTSSPFMFRATWTLAPEVLLGWGRWNAGVRTYLQNAAELNLLDLVEAYVADISDLYVWLRNEQMREHQADIDATNLMINELNDMWPPDPA